MRSDGKNHDAQTPTELLGQAVRQRRRELRLKQEEVARLAAVGPVFLYDLEHGKATLRIDKVLSVLQVLGLELQLRNGKRALTVASELA